MRYRLVGPFDSTKERIGEGRARVLGIAAVLLSSSAGLLVMTPLAHLGSEASCPPIQGTFPTRMLAYGAILAAMGVFFGFAALRRKPEGLSPSLEREIDVATRSLVKRWALLGASIPTVMGIFSSLSGISHGACVISFAEALGFYAVWTILWVIATQRKATVQVRGRH